MKSGGERRTVEMGGEKGGERAYEAVELVEAIDDVDAF